jgi:uncharacterized Zn finger protein (UPF0148 family)
MEVRGRRECKECGTQWSYFETGSTACPECGSKHSVGIGDRVLHTNRASALDLAEAQELAAAGSLREAAEAASEAALAYIKGRGYIDAGELQLLEETAVAAHELRHAASELGRRLSISEAETYYFGELLEGAPEGERPPPEDVPDSLAGARGLGAAAAVRAYREDLRQWIDREGAPEEASSLLGSLGSQVRRIRALDGTVPPAEADRLVTAARSLGAYLRDDEESDLEQARAALEALE